MPKRKRNQNRFRFKSEPLGAFKAHHLALKLGIILYGPALSISHKVFASNVLRYFDSFSHVGL